MHSPAMIIVTSRLLDLQAEAAANRLATNAKRSSRQNSGRIATAVASLRSLLANPSEGSMAMPKLSDYPYRS